MDLELLIRQSGQGDHDAFAELVRSTHVDTWRMARYMVGPDDADDVTQEIFIRTWRACPAFVGDSSARTWMHSIARNTCADAVRRKIRQRRLSLLAGRPGTTVAMQDLAGHHALDDLVAHLSDKHRDAFVLTQIVGCSYADAAEACGVPVGTIRSRVARARAELLDAVRRARAS